MIDTEFPITDSVLFVLELNNSSLEEKQSLINDYIQPRKTTAKELIKELGNTK